MRKEWRKQKWKTEGNSIIDLFLLFVLLCDQNSSEVSSQGVRETDIQELPGAGSHQGKRKGQKGCKECGQVKKLLYIWVKNQYFSCKSCTFRLSCSISSTSALLTEYCSNSSVIMFCYQGKRRKKLKLKKSGPRLLCFFFSFLFSLFSFSFSLLVGSGTGGSARRGHWRRRRECWLWTSRDSPQPAACPRSG